MNHYDLGLLETYFIPNLERFAIRTLTFVMRGLLEQLDEIAFIIPFLNAFYKNYFKRFLKLVSSFIQVNNNSQEKSGDKWNKK